MADDAYRSGLHETDIYAWAVGQAEGLRERVPGDDSLEYDLIAEELDDLAASQRRACESRMLRIIEHLLKIEYVGPVRVVHHWRMEIVNFRTELESTLTPTLRVRLPETIPKHYAGALRRLKVKLDDRMVVTLPSECPYSWDDILGRGDDWTPAPLYPPD